MGYEAVATLAAPGRAGYMARGPLARGRRRLARLAPSRGAPGRGGEARTSATGGVSHRGALDVAAGRRAPPWSLRAASAERVSRRPLYAAHLTNGSGFSPIAPDSRRRRRAFLELRVDPPTWTPSDANSCLRTP